MRNIRIEGAGRGISGGRLVHPGPTGIGIDFDNSYHFGAISATLPTGALTDAWVEYQAAPGLAYVRASSIPQGLPCRFACSGNANSGGPTSWAIVYTVIDLAGPTLFDYHIRSVSELAGRTTFNWVGGVASNDYLQNNHNNPWLMPPHDLNLSFRLFGGYFTNGQPDQTPLQNGDPSLYY